MKDLICRLGPSYSAYCSEKTIFSCIRESHGLWLNLPPLQRERLMQERDGKRFILAGFLQKYQPKTNNQKETFGTEGQHINPQQFFNDFVSLATKYSYADTTSIPTNYPWVNAFCLTHLSLPASRGNAPRSSSTLFVSVPLQPESVSSSAGHSCKHSFAFSSHSCSRRRFVV